MTEHVEPLPAPDRTDWPPGPWDGEPDGERFDHLGLPCLVTRQEAGYLCGYVAIPPGHPWHGMDLDEVPAEAHGGITYAQSCAGHVCHVPKPGEPADVWWIGFDCRHAFDMEPGWPAALRELLGPMPGVYRAFPYVRAQVVALAEQARAAHVGTLAAQQPKESRHASA